MSHDGYSLYKGVKHIRTQSIHSILHTFHFLILTIVTTSHASCFSNLVACGVFLHMQVLSRDIDKPLANVSLRDLVSIV